MTTRYVPVSHEDPVEHRRLLASGINQSLDGKINSVGSFTLEANQASTIITDLRVGTQSVILFMPTTANAAAEHVSGNMYVSSKNVSVGGSYFTIAHTNNAQTDRDFLYAVIG